MKSKKTERPQRTKDQIAFDKAMDDAESFNASPEGQAQFEAIEKETPNRDMCRASTLADKDDLPF